MTDIQKAPATQPENLQKRSGKSLKEPGISITGLEPSARPSTRPDTDP